MLASLDTVTDVFTRYAVPVSVLCTVAEPVLAIVADVNDTVGAVESATDTTKLVVTVAPSASAAVRVIVELPVRPVAGLNVTAPAVAELMAAERFAVAFGISVVLLELTVRTH
jgi:hypothetical protein